MQDPQPTPPDPYDASALTEDREMDTSVLAFVQDNPISTGVIVFLVLAAFLVAMRRRRGS